MKILSFSTVLILASVVGAAPIHVPKDHQTIQAAIDAAKPGDIVLVAPGKYLERLKLKPGITLRSSGEEPHKSERVWERAKVTIIDGGGTNGNAPGVQMAENSVLEGFTITNVGKYDEAIWQKHATTQGEELGDEEGSVQAEGTIPAISIPNVTCQVMRCVVHHNGDVGIAVSGKGPAPAHALVTLNHCYRNMGGGIGVAMNAEPIILENLCEENLRAGIGCRQANPTIQKNICKKNIRAGIGCREGAQPIIRENKCSQNLRAGIGIRMENTKPIVLRNECFENEMAGIGCRDGASPVIRDNHCHHNKMAGIGCRDGAKPLIIGNECRDNKMAGIGMQGKANATIMNNQVHDNLLVAIGVTEESTATIISNVLSRKGGMPPLLAVKDQSTAHIQKNQFHGGGVAGLLIQGKVTVLQNEFTGIGEKQGTAIWIWEKSDATIQENRISGYRTAVRAGKSAVLIVGNHAEQFQGTAFSIADCPTAVITGNRGCTDHNKVKLVEVTGMPGITHDNELETTPLRK
ncbi:MAG: right-handed parallel beta-helix repeat-containing protein [Zavarzinella sp.]